MLLYCVFDFVNTFHYFLPPGYKHAKFENKAGHDYLVLILNNVIFLKTFIKRQQYYRMQHGKCNYFQLNLRL